MPERRRALVLGYVVAVTTTAVAIGLRALLQPLLGSDLPFPTIYAAVAVSVWYGGYGPALFAATLGYVAARYLFLGSQSFGTGTPSEIAALILYFSACFIIIGFGSGYRASVRRYQTIAERALEKQRALEQAVAERDQAERASRESEARQAAVLETALDAIVTIDGEGKVVEFNPAAERMFGYRRTEVTGRLMAELIIPPSQRENHFRGFARYRETGEARVLNRRLELTAMRADGSEFPVELAITRLNKDGPPMFTAYLRDITDRQQSEKAVREADRRKDEFLATLAHELRNPLAPIRGTVDLLRMTKPTDGDLDKSLNLIDRQLHHLTRLVDDLLDVSRITRGAVQLRRERIAVADIVSTAVETSRALIERQEHELTLVLPPGPLFVTGDLTRLAQVVSNVLNNAAKYTPRGGRIWLRTDRRDGDVTISVRDTGVGIPPDKLSSVFEMFRQLDDSLERAAGGLGIGLTLAQRLMEMHGGTIEARSDGPGRGSEFILSLPLSVAEIQGAADAFRLTPRHDSMRRRILIADDSADFAESMSHLLSVMGHDTRTACDGLEAVETADSFQPDVVLLDIGMPRLNGYDAARRIRDQANGRHVLLIALTGWGQEEDKRRAAEAGFDHHLTKPADLALLTRLLDQH